MAKQAASKSKFEEEHGFSSDALFEDGPEKPLEESHFTIHAPQGVGKTFLGLSADPSYPDDLHAKKKIVLENIIHIAFDKGALDGIGQYGLSVKHRVDARKLLRAPRKNQKQPHAEDGAMQALDWITDAVAERIDKYNIKAVIFDTLTNGSTEILKYAENMDFRSEKTGKADKFAMWAFIGHALSTLWEWGANQPCQMIWLCHSKAVGDEGLVAGTHMKPGSDQARLEQLKARANKGLGDWEIVPAMDGKKAIEVFTSHSSLIATMTADYNEETKRYERFVLPRGGRGFLGKNRWFDLLGEREPANLQKIFAKIRRG
jgi:hypothetical protein